MNMIKYKTIMNLFCIMKNNYYSNNW